MLKKYKSSDFKLLQSWVTNAELLFQFSGTDFSYPLQEKHFNDYQKRHPERSFYFGYSSEKVPFAFGEIIPQEDGVPRLGRILVGESALRGQGLGRYFVQLLLEQCKLLYSCKYAELFVWDKNIAAIKCYQSIGFRYGDKYKTLIYEGRSFNIHKMVYTY